MQKIIIDTNIVISSLIGNSFPKQIVFDIILSQKAELILSKEIFAEYIEVLHRDKFRKYPTFLQNAEILLNKLDEMATYFVPTEKLKIISDDFDNRFLELGIISNADFLVTGNTNHFNFSVYKNLQIVTAQEFVNTYFSG